MPLRRSACLPPLPTIPPTPARGAATAPQPPPSPPPPPAIPSVITDREGKFVIPDLEAGSYRLTVSGSGYVRQEYGQRVFPGQGTLLTLTAGQVMKDIVMKLTLTGNVSGRLRDMSGEPAVGVPIQLLKASYSPQGQKIFQSAGSTRTNDRGEYRLYWVTPGRYFLAAGSTAGPSGGGPFSVGGPPVSPNDPNDNYGSPIFRVSPTLARQTASMSPPATRQPPTLLSPGSSPIRFADALWMPQPINLRPRSTCRSLFPQLPEAAEPSA